MHAHRLQHPNLLHSRGIRCVAISGDGTFIVSGDISGTLKVWDRHNRLCTFTLTKAAKAHVGGVYGMDISKDDTLSAAATTTRRRGHATKTLRNVTKIFLAPRHSNTGLGSNLKNSSIKNVGIILTFEGQMHNTY
jgi:WD40 repeat protein